MALIIASTLAFGLVIKRDIIENQQNYHARKTNLILQIKAYEAALHHNIITTEILKKYHHMTENWLYNIRQYGEKLLSQTKIARGTIRNQQYGSLKSFSHII